MPENQEKTSLETNSPFQTKIPYRCPHCGEINQIQAGQVQYECQKCKRQNATCDLIFWQ